MELAAARVILECMAGSNGKKPPKPTQRDLRLATAIATALTPELTALREEMREGFAAMGRELAGVREDVRQLQSGAVGVGRITALETRVSELERKR